jgi:hypothetical protein
MTGKKFVSAAKSELQTKTEIGANIANAGNFMSGD